MAAPPSFRAETELGALCNDLIADLERLRPGLTDEAGADGVLAAARERTAVRLEELYRERYELGAELGGAADGAGHGAQLALYRREVEQILLPRWAALAVRQNGIERARPDPMHGADGFNRAAWAFIFLLVGAFVVWAPFIPIWEKWIPFVAGGVAAYFAPVLPDLHAALGRRRHALQLLTLLIDLDRAGQDLPTLPAAPVMPALPAPTAPADDGGEGAKEGPE